MAITSPITGSAQTGFSSPSATIVRGAQKANGVDFAVTALSGMGSSTSNTASSPFVVSVEKPVSIKTPKVSAAGIVYSPGRNRHRIATLKGMAAIASFPSIPGIAETFIAVPAGAEEGDPNNIRAMISVHIGVLQQYSAALGDQVVSGVVTA